MGLGELLLLALGVSMDAFAVSICKGLAFEFFKFLFKLSYTQISNFSCFHSLIPPLPRFAP